MIFDSKNIFIEWHESEIPWLKIFTKEPYKELSDAPKETKDDIFLALDICEKLLINHFAPEKINIASFGNYLPKVHFHIMARFKNDQFFPESMWGVKQRESTLNLPSFDLFEKALIGALNSAFNQDDRYL